MAMELEYIFRILILLVVVAVVIGLILSFKDQISNIIKQFLNNLGGSKQTPQFPKLIDKGSGTFATGEIVTYINSCYSALTAMSVTERPAGITNCYILKGSFATDSSRISQSVGGSLQNKLNITADFSRGAVVIAYQDPEGIILVK